MGKSVLLTKTKKKKGGGKNGEQNREGLSNSFAYEGFCWLFVGGEGGKGREGGGGGGALIACFYHSFLCVTCTCRLCMSILAEPYCRSIGTSALLS